MMQAAGGGSRSSINKAEANLVAQLVLKLLQAPAPNSRVEGRSQQQQQHEDDEDMDEGGECSDAAPRALAAHQLGVVCFFRGQAALIKQTIAAGTAPVMRVVMLWFPKSAASMLGHLSNLRELLVRFILWLAGSQTCLTS